MLSSMAMMWLLLAFTVLLLAPAVAQVWSADVRLPQVSPVVVATEENQRSITRYSMLAVPLQALLMGRNSK